MAIPGKERLKASSWQHVEVFLRGFPADQKGASSPAPAGWRLGTHQRGLQPSHPGASAPANKFLRAAGLVLCPGEVFAQRARQELRYPLLIQRHHFAKRAKLGAPAKNRRKQNGSL